MLKVAVGRRAAEALPRIVAVREGRVPEAFAAAARAAGFSGKTVEVCEPAAAPRVVLAGLGPAPTRLDAERAGAAAAARLSETPHVVLEGDAAPETLAEMAAGVVLGTWRFDVHRTRDVALRLGRLTIACDDTAATRRAWERAAASVRGCLLARDLVAEPANVLTTQDFAKRMEALTAFGLEVEVLGRKQLEKAGFGALLAVGGGSATPPRLVVLRWRGGLDAPPVAFVGKGIVFDTGGVSIKPAGGMAAMRADMAGAAACAGAMLSLALRNSPSRAVAVLALAENAVGAASYRPGDVLRTLSGRTVEVVDTDAEGRLVLADALHHAASAVRPRAMLDLATLTGAVVTALGHHRAGLFGNDHGLMASVAAAGAAVGEETWPMPIGEGHRADLASDIADLRQCMPAPRGEGGWAAGRIPDACHAAAFLREFAGGVPWAHLDIAGVDTADAPHALGPAGPTGFGVRLLDELVARRFEEPDHHPPVAQAGARV